MRYWWVNQNQTYRHEVTGGYLWSPKRNRNGGANPFYDSMREVALGDVVFSFADTRIKAIGVATGAAYEAPKPREFGETGAYWHHIGWRVDVRFVEVRLTIRPSERMDVLGPLLPAKYAPLQANGAGLQGVYLTRLPEEFAGALIDLIGAEARDIIRGHIMVESTSQQPAVGLFQWEEHVMEAVQRDSSLDETERAAIVLARRGQGKFKKNVMRLERACRITGITREEHLRASHCKPWRVASNEERLDGENGLLLTPNADHLFDRGFIGFENNGDLLISPIAHVESLHRMGLDLHNKVNVGGFSDGQRRYLEFHRESVLLRSRFLDKT
jgi:putative restriction endonuclease